MAEKLSSFIYPEQAVLAAPLSGYTDLLYRRTLRRAGCVYAFTEMVDAASIAYNNANSEMLLRRGDDEPWLGVQLVGGEPEQLKIAADEINRHEFDVFDFNLGCPVPKVAKKHAGAALGRDIPRALECFELLAARVRFPITAKIRILDENDPEPTLKLARGLAERGARAITVHGRVMAKFYSGTVFTDIIAACRTALPHVQIIANGGIMSLRDAENMRRATGCGAVMVARGMMGNPWIFRELSDRDGFVPPTVAEWGEAMTRQVEEMMEFYGETSGMILARKIILDYLRGRGFGGEVKNRAATLATRDAFFAFRDWAVARGPAASYFQQPHAERALRLN